ncbi:hypothetical protein KTO58_20170 [Chitinophaga pendula]|uniref:hypothetical protein n=1 Tax=Chitinophaga TaxID=79328 RepID=UPI000BAF55CD|nr:MULTISPECIES: hypothetical protein [Chitinophaga]ASZ11021.1 hypothetical protein CK934_08625 [Chitinophaga sp. MD30]UCJ05983.1 hypothetical protein KTO58_20170 [Chitinophaga pendula]
MSEELLRITVVSDFTNLLRAKWLNFIRRSFWRLLFAAIFATVGLHMAEYTATPPVRLFMLILLGALLLSMITMWVSAGIQARQRAQYPIYVSLYPGFLIWQDMRTKKELKVKREQIQWYRESPSGVVFHIQSRPLLSEYMIVDKQKLPEKEYDILLYWLKTQ